MKLLPKSILEIKTEMKIPNILVYVAAFIFVTVGLIFLNSIYSNIFKFDFSPISMKDSLSVASTVSKNSPELEMNKQLNKKAEPVGETDSTSNNNINPVKESKKDSVMTPPKAKLIPQVIPVSDKPETQEPNVKEYSLKRPAEGGSNQTTAVNDNEMVLSNSIIKSSVDTIYQQWIKQTAKLYESMDPKKAALIIKNYSETTARDIIYKMKKNKAADVLSELDPLTANRIANFPGDERSAFLKN